MAPTLTPRISVEVPSAGLTVCNCCGDDVPPVKQLRLRWEEEHFGRKHGGGTLVSLCMSCLKQTAKAIIEAL